WGTAPPPTFPQRTASRRGRFRGMGPARTYHPVPSMRLVTYERGGVRRLGALVDEGRAIDLADAVGHPAFPSTLEGLVGRSGGTTVDAAHEAAARPDNAEEFAIGRPALVAPFTPEGARSPVLGPS